MRTRDSGDDLSSDTHGTASAGNKDTRSRLSSRFRRHRAPAAAVRSIYRHASLLQVPCTISARCHESQTQGGSAANARGTSSSPVHILANRPRRRPLAETPSPTPRRDLFLERAKNASLDKVRVSGAQTPSSGLVSEWARHCRGRACLPRVFLGLFFFEADAVPRAGRARETMSSYNSINYKVGAGRGEAAG
jgi:hypothetical protein